MASIKKLNPRKYKINVSNGYRLDGRKISRAKTITVPESVHPRSIAQYVAHEAEDFERYVKNGFSEDADTPFAAERIPLRRRARAARPPRYVHKAPAEDLRPRRSQQGVPPAHLAAFFCDIPAPRRRGQTDGRRPRGSWGHVIFGTHLLPPADGAQAPGVGMSLHTDLRTDHLRRRRR